MMEKCCGTCANWDAPTLSPVRVGHGYPCAAPIAWQALPDALRLVPTRAGDGTACPCWFLVEAPRAFVGSGVL